ncbi:MAG: F-box/WD repeat-containing protein [Verrucomicrobia bacterium]|nr:F-box/WD repeat-containing protein [Verrucomicrobiota bacterium]
MSVTSSTTTTTSPQAAIQLFTQTPAAPQFGLASLPPDVLINILRMLSIQQFGALNQTCRQFCFITSNNPLTFLLSQHFPNFQKKDPNQTELEAIKEQHRINSNQTKGVYASHTLEGHDGIVFSLALDGQTLFSGSFDNTIKIWNLNTNTCTATLQGHNGPVCSLALDGQLLISGSYDRTVKIWDLSTNTCIATLEGYNSPVFSLALDGQRLFSGSYDGTIKIWDLTTNTSTATIQGHNDCVSSLAKDGQKLFSGSYDKTVKIWDLSTNTCTATLQGHDSPVFSLTMDEQRLFSGSSDKTIKIWDLTTNTCTATLQGHNGPVWSLARDGQRLFSGSADKTIRICDFNAPDEAVFKEIADLLKSKDSVIAEDAMARFTRMPPKAKNAIYQELLEIQGSSANDDGKDTFDNQNGQTSTPDQMAQAILNYLAKSKRS